MKYIILEAPERLPWILLFTAPLTHSEVAELAAAKGYSPVSAGYFDPSKQETFGSSSTLDLLPRPGDAKMIIALANHTAGGCPEGGRVILPSFRFGKEIEDLRASCQRLQNTLDRRAGEEKKAIEAAYQAGLIDGAKKQAVPS